MFSLIVVVRFAPDVMDAGDQGLLALLVIVATAAGWAITHRWRRR